MSSTPPVRRRRRPVGRARAVALPVVLAGALAIASLGVGCTPARFRTVFHDDFSGTELHERWFTYRGSPSSDPDATWTADRVRVEDGAVVLDAVPVPGRAGQWDVGGLADGADPLTYGRWTIRFRVTPSAVLSWHLLLWPQDESWPPEIDIAEGWDQARAKAEGFVHYLDAAGTHQRPYHQVLADFTQWNTVVLTWTPTSITWALNGVEWASVSGDAVPTVPMRLSMQAETQACRRAQASCLEDTATPTGSTPRIEVDDVVVEAYVGPGKRTV